jgi:hypothetical protein
MLKAHRFMTHEELLAGIAEVEAEVRESVAKRVVEVQAVFEENVSNPLIDRARTDAEWREWLRRRQSGEARPLRVCEAKAPSPFYPGSSCINPTL